MSELPEFIGPVESPEILHERQMAALEERREAEWREAVGRVCPAPETQTVFAGDMVETEAAKSVNAWLSAMPRKVLVLRGGVGCGKSVAAALAVKHWCRPAIGKSADPFNERPVTFTVIRGLSCAWLSPDDVVSAVMHAYDDKSPKLCPYLVIDDMGRESKPEFAEALCRLLDSGKHTMVITTNLSKQQLRERYPDLRLIDRLNHAAMATDLKSKSLRRQDGGF
jgi:DNA replication protein DnaC